MLSAIEPLQRMGVKIDSATLNTPQLLGKLRAGRADLVSDYYASLALNLTAPQRELGERWWTEIARLRDLPPYRPD